MKFTSEDLLKAMGLKVGDTIKSELFPLTLKVVENEQTTFLRSPVGNDYSLYIIIGYDYTIIKPKPTLTEDEKVILRNLPKEFKWVVRDKVGDVNIFFEKPERDNNGFIEYWEGSSKTLFMFNHLFQFIKWEDEPYSIEELLKE